MGVDSESISPQLGAAVSLAFDLDVDAPLFARSQEAGSRLTSLSEARYAIRRAMPRLLALLARERIKATFYVPGAVAQSHPHAVEALLEAGHELGHHGHRHLWSHTISDAEQVAEIDSALEVFDRLFRVRPSGYRSPAWELTPMTAELLIERQFTFDSSLMHDDRPYLIEIGKGSMVELPVHWSLDDWVYFGWSPDRATAMCAPATVLSAWTDELVSAVEENRHVTFTMHPEVIGRGQRLLMLEQLIEAVHRYGGRFAAHGDVASDAARAPESLGKPIRIVE